MIHLTTEPFICASQIREMNINNSDEATMNKKNDYNIHHNIEPSQTTAMYMNKHSGDSCISFGIVII